MPREIEAKLKLDDVEGLRRRLVEVGAVRLGCETLRDDYLDTADQRLLTVGHGMRIRVGEKAILTYKGPRRESRFKAREELEVGVDDPAVLLELLTNVGFQVIFSYEKRRETWRLDACEVMVDELPTLGFFVEIEGTAEETVADVIERLSLDEHPVIQHSYPHLILEHIRKSSPESTSLFFS